MKLTDEQVKKLFDMLSESLKIDQIYDGFFSMKRQARFDLYNEICEAQKKNDLLWE